MASHPSDDQDATSDYGDSITTSEFTSLNTTRLLHSYEHGRRGVLQGRYGMPNDDAEQLREGVKHRLYSDYILEGKLFIAPVGPRPQKIVDLGTGFGLWALDVAEQYPSARVIGVDLSPIQPNWLPPNLEFRVEDLDDEYRPWTNIYLGADLMHLRFLLPTVRRPELLLRNCLENLKPGGWIEIHDIIPRIFSDDGTAGDNHPIHILYKHIDGPFSSVYGWNLQFPPSAPRILESLGFVNITVRRNAIPIGRWHNDARLREMGVFSQSLLSDWLVTMLHRYETLGLDADGAHKLGQDILDAFNNPRIHAQHDWLDVWAQKPLS
ncbi:UMTA methyltransferase family protein [Purpureocillium lilacinum]|nr:UMTA methyltransferase family protein [Purpureocillium lilacinum]OAQ86721.1 UMTA methyltransferase family protein [Purpureocillium lilacinum]OAQ94683.1 UMTA methyltransferase family protein [Purpureocillium lilacinum]